MAAIVLAGGRSERMGVIKATLPWRGKRLVDHMVEMLRRVSSRVLVVTAEAELDLPEPAMAVVDELPEAGPLAALLTGLRWAGAGVHFACGVDMPFLREEVVNLLLSRATDYDVVTPETADGLHPLCAAYSAKCLAAIEWALGRGESRLQSFFPQVQVRLVPEAELRAIDPHLDSLININTWDEYRQALNRDRELPPPSDRWLRDSDGPVADR